jgi:hypothetical protein
MAWAVIYRSIAAPLLALALLSSCREGGRSVREVSFKEYSGPGCWFREGEDLKALLVVAGEDSDGERVPWFVSSKCIAREDMPSYGSATLYLLGPPRVVDPRGLLRKHVTPQMGPDNQRTHLPLPSEDSPIYYIVARLEPVRDRPHLFEIRTIKRVVPTDARFVDLLEMGPAERSRLVARVS